MTSKQNVKLDAERICRICMQEKTELYSIYDETPVELGATIVQILNECTYNVVDRCDEMPHQMCTTCIGEARSAYRFKRRADDSYRTLVSLLGRISGKNKDIQVDNSTQTEQCTLPNNVLYHCEICEEKFINSSDLRHHRNLEHRMTLGKIIRCKVCGERFERLRLLQMHLLEQHQEERLVSELQCQLCQRVFSRKDHLQRHMRNVHKRNENKILKLLEEPELILTDMAPKLEPTTAAFDSCWTSFKDFEIDCDDGYQSVLVSNCYEGTNPISSDDDTEKQLDIDKNTLCLALEPEVIIDPKEPVSDIFKKHIDQPKAHVNVASNSVSKCDICDRSFGRKYHLVRHLQQVHKVPMNISKAFEGDSHNTITQDTSTVTLNDEREYQSHSTTTTLRPRAKIVREYLNQKTKNPYQRSNNPENRCYQCQRTFSRHCHLLRHMLSHLDQKPHSCPHCQKGFARSDHLKAHILSLHRDKSHKCSSCDAAFSSPDALNRHKQAKHDVGDSTALGGNEMSDCAQLNALKIHPCEYCDKKFASKSYLRKHTLLHSDRLFACKHCDETFKDRSLLREHGKTHAAEQRNFLCCICGESFARNDYLRVHMRRHNGEKPYKCQYCGKGFTRATDVKVHERYHTGTKPHLCTLCGKGFHRAYNLTIHMRTHTGERPYKCDQCPKSFTQSNDLKAHIRRHTGERYKCTECDACFLQLYSMRQHALSVHGKHIESKTGRLQKSRLDDDDGPKVQTVMVAPTRFDKLQQSKEPQQQSQQNIPESNSYVSTSPSTLQQLNLSAFSFTPATMAP